MFKFFKKETEARKRSLEYIQNQRKENLEDFILILKQIQEANNKHTTGKGSFFKNYKEKQLLVDNIVELAIEKTEEKIMELG